VSSSPPRLILASRSPRRRALLAEAGYTFEVIPPDESVEDAVYPDAAPEAVVAELALRKARDVAARIEDAHALVLACDTVVECGGRLLGKPIARDDARAMLHRLRGQEHRVLSGLCLWPVNGDLPRVRVEVTTLRMDAISDDELEAYLAGDGWQGKAGAFGYQDRTGWVHVVSGSESNVVGLPLELLAAMLGERA